LDERSGVDVVGSVPDVRPYYDQASVVVAPFAFGGGTKLKILEGLAMERGIVTTPVGSAGIKLTDGEHALIRERSPEFANSVITLLSDPTERSRLGANGRELVRERYEWNTIMSSALDSIDGNVL
jgi:glycosyltransferase involved in cell wall biosynthesis